MMPMTTMISISENPPRRIRIGLDIAPHPAPVTSLYDYCPTTGAIGQQLPAGCAVAPGRKSRNNHDVARERKFHMPENAPLQVGQMAPDFKLMNQDKNEVKLSDYRGKKKV